ncbi:MAG: NAD-dependent epimerase/dehydratase family protein [Burkholderiales bacterium]
MGCVRRCVARFMADEKPDYVFLATAKVGGIAANNAPCAELIYQNLMIASHSFALLVRPEQRLLFLGSS